MTMTRRNALKLAGAAGLAVPLGAGGCSVFGSDVTGQLLTSQVELPQPFQMPLPVPPVLEPVRSRDGVDYYEVTQEEGSAEILPGHKTTVWGYNGIFPGPTFETRSGRQVVVRQRNELPTPISTHLHGGHTPPRSDGYPTNLVLPTRGGSPTYAEHGDSPGWTFHRGHKDYTFPQQQRATTLWYHDHRMDFTGPQVWRGLAGFHIIRDDEDDALPLPRGDRDIPLMICDRSFAADGSLRYPALDPSLQGEMGVRRKYMEGVLGDVVLVNGAAWPYLEVSNTRYRFRLLNASNARRYELTLDPPPPEGAVFTQVGSDGGLLAAPVGHDTIPIAQAERFDVIIDFSKYPVGTSVTLRNRIGGDSTARVMQFRVTRKEKDTTAVPRRLSDMSEFEQLRESGAAATRRFNFTRGGSRDGRPVWTINNKMFDPARMDARPRLGTTEIWEFVTDVHHPVHIHLVQFKVLGRARNGQKPLPTDTGWKDTVDLRPGNVARVLVPFTGYRGRYIFHCHNLEHEDMAMMAAFEVV